MTSKKELFIYIFKSKIKIMAREPKGLDTTGLTKRTHL